MVCNYDLKPYIQNVMISGLLSIALANMGVKILKRKFQFFYLKSGVIFLSFASFKTIDQP